MRLFTLLLAMAVAAPAAAQTASMYDSLTVSTITGRARRSTSGYVTVAKSSQTPTVYTIVLDGPTGGVNASSGVFTYGITSGTMTVIGALTGSIANFSGAVSAQNITAGSGTFTGGNGVSVTYGLTAGSATVLGVLTGSIANFSGAVSALSVAASSITAAYGVSAATAAFGAGVYRDVNRVVDIGQIAGAPGVATSALRIGDASIDVGMDFGTYSAGTWLQAGNGGFSASYALLLNPNGGVVSIGGSPWSDDQTLDIIGQATARGQFTVAGASATANGSMTIRGAGGLNITSGGAMIAGQATIVSSVTIRVGADKIFQVIDNGVIQLQTLNDARTVNPRMQFSGGDYNFLGSGGIMSAGQGTFVGSVTVRNIMLSSATLPGDVVGHDFHNAAANGYVGLDFYNEAGTRSSSLFHGNTASSYPGTWLTSRVAEKLNLGANGLNQHLVIDTGGSVGIGTSSPAKTLDVRSSGVASHFRGGAGGYSALTFSGDAGASTGSITTYAGNIAIGSENAGGTGTNGEIKIASVTHHVYINDGNSPATGNLIVGASIAPDEKLVVYGAVRSVGNATNWAASDGTVIDYNAGTARLVAARTGANSSVMDFYTYNSGVAGVALRLTAAGKVGVGGVTPDGWLTINGTTNDSHFSYDTAEDTYIRGGKATSDLYLNDASSGETFIQGNGGSVGLGTFSPGALFHVNGEASGYVQKWSTGTAAAQAMGEITYGDSPSRMMFRAGANKGLNLGANETNYFYMHTDGKVGLSQDAGVIPSTTLDVNGSAQFGSGATKSTFTATGKMTMGGGFVLKAYGRAGFQALTPTEEGEMFRCNTCSPTATICIATGTAVNQWARIYNYALGCDTASP